MNIERDRYGLDNGIDDAGRTEASNQAKGKEYLAQRKAYRSIGPTREERGLSHHPDGSGKHICPDCEGAGETIHNDTNPYGFGPDPQCDEPIACITCLGSGEIADGVSEVLIELRAARHRMRLRLKGARVAYQSTRRRAFMPASGLPIEAEQRT